MKRTMVVLLRDMRYGTRMVGRHAGFTAVAILTLTLGIVNTAPFSVVTAVLLRLLPYKHFIPGPPRHAGRSPGVPAPARKLTGEKATVVISVYPRVTAGAEQQ